MSPALAPAAAIAARLLLGAWAAAAAAVPDAGAAVPDEPPPDATEPPADTWVDRSHRLLEEGLSGLTGRVDAFFGDERVAEAEQASSFIHVRNEVRTAEDKLLAGRVRALASLKLPGLDRWLRNARLVASGESQASPSPDLSQDPVTPAYSPTLRAEQAALELRMDLLDQPPSVVDVGAGERIRLPPETFVRSRFRRKLSPGLGVTGRFTQSVFWTNREGFGESTELSLARPLAARTLLRWAGAAALTDVSPGLTFTGELGVLREIQEFKTVAYVAVAANGHTRPVSTLDLYKAFLRLRRSVWRSWLFVEVEPEVGFPETPQRARHRVLALTLRLEVQLAGRAAAP